MNSILNGFLIFGIIQAFLFVGLLLSKNKRSGADLIMTAWLLLFSVHSFLILVNSNNTNNNWILQIIPVSFTLLYGPFLWIYVVEIMSTIKVRKGAFLHFVPFTIFFTLSLVFFKSNVLLKILAFSGVISGIVYCFLTYKLLNEYRIHIVNHFSSIEKINLRWVKRLLWGLITIWTGAVIVVFITRFLNIQLPINWFFLFIPSLIAYLGSQLSEQIIYKKSPMNPNFEAQTFKKIRNHGLNKIRKKR